MQSIFYYVIYERPSDYPDSFVCRRHEQLPGGFSLPRDLVGVTPDLESIRGKLPPSGLMRAAPDPSDNPAIVETWL